VKVLAHLSPHAPHELLGVWCQLNGGAPPTAFYPHGGAPEAYGRAVVARELRHRSWADVAEHLASRPPHSAWWEEVELPGPVSPAEAFDEIVSRLDVTWTAEQLAGRVGLPTAPLNSVGHRLSTLFDFRVNDHTLAVILSNPDLPQHQADLALAYGLAWVGDRDLVIVLPASRVEPTRERLAFIEVPVRLWEFDATGVRPVAPLTKGEVLERFAEPLRGTIAHDLRDRTAWVADLLTRAHEHHDLDAVVRPKYLAWHCEGRQVLKVQRSTAGLSIVAGVDYRDPTTARPIPVRLELDRPLSAVELAVVLDAVEVAVENRLNGTDNSHREHRFQARLARRTEELGFERMLREVPARRAGGGAGFIDLLGLTARGELRAIETKLGGDAMLALQALDYWIWSTANQEQIGRDLFGERVERVGVDLVVGSRTGTSSPLGPYTAAQLEAFDPQVAWRLRVWENWRRDP